MKIFTGDYINSNGSENAFILRGITDPHVLPPVQDPAVILAFEEEPRCPAAVRPEAGAPPALRPVLEVIGINTLIGGFLR